MEPTDHERFLRHLSQSLDQNALFSGWFFVHVVGTSPDTHAPLADDEVNSAWAQLENLVSVRQTDMKDWKVLVQLRLRNHGNVTLIKSSSRLALLTSILPRVPPPVLDNELRRPHSIVTSYNYNGASTFQASTGHLEDNQGIEHVYVQSHLRSPPGWKLFSPSDLFDKQMIRMMKLMQQRMTKIHESIRPNAEAREIWTSVTILTSYVGGKNAGRLNLHDLVEVIGGRTWW